MAAFDLADSTPPDRRKPAPAKAAPRISLADEHALGLASPARGLQARIEMQLGAAPHRIELSPAARIAAIGTLAIASWGMLGSVGYWLVRLIA